MGDRKPTLMLIALVLISGLALPPTATANAQTQKFLSVRGRWIVDADGQPIILRGVNFPGYEYSDLLRETWLHAEADYGKFARSGFNVVRLPIVWAMLEPRPGVFDMSYLTKYVSRDVQWAKKHGLYIVLDMHQWKWGEKFGGCGAPEWTLRQYPPTEAGMRAAVSNFWIDSSLQDDFTRMWSEIARTYANEPAIAGYDILNEPWVYTSVIPYLNATYVDNFYMKVIASIRSVDPNHIIFLEPANMNTFKFPLKENIVWAPHFYPLSFESRYFRDNVTTLEADLRAKYDRFVLQLGSPVWIGEFGAFMKDMSRDYWLEDATQLFDKYQVGWAWWAYGQDAAKRDQTIPDCVALSVS